MHQWSMFQPGQPHVLLRRQRGPDDLCLRLRPRDRHGFEQAPVRHRQGAWRGARWRDRRCGRPLLVGDRGWREGRLLQSGWFDCAYRRGARADHYQPNVWRRQSGRDVRDLDRREGPQYGAWSRRWQSIRDQGTGRERKTRAAFRRLSPKPGGGGNRLERVRVSVSEEIRRGGSRRRILVRTGGDAMDRTPAVTQASSAQRRRILAVALSAIAVMPVAAVLAAA